MIRESVYFLLEDIAKHMSNTFMDMDDTTSEKVETELADIFAVVDPAHREAVYGMFMENMEDAGLSVEKGKFWAEDLNENSPS